MTPTLSQVRSYKTDHLTTAAKFWTSTADTWETVFNRVRLETHEMGWQGMAAEAAMQASHDDWQHVIGHSDDLRGAASTATHAAQELAGAHREVLDTVGDIQNQGFAVGEDWSVTDQITGSSGARAARIALAQQLSDALRSKVAAFLKREESTGTDLTRSAATLGKVGFSTAHGAVQGVDLKRDGGPDSTDQIAPWDTPGGTTPGGSTFLPQYEQRLTAPPAQAAPGPPMPVPPPPGPPAPIDSPACRDKLGEAERERERRLGGSILKGAVIGGVGGAIAGMASVGFLVPSPAAAWEVSAPTSTRPPSRTHCLRSASNEHLHTCGPHRCHGDWDFSRHPVSRQSQIMVGDGGCVDDTAAGVRGARRQRLARAPLRCIRHCLVGHRCGRHGLRATADATPRREAAEIANSLLALIVLCISFLLGLVLPGRYRIPILHKAFPPARSLHLRLELRG
jgi:hypothetical protein